MSQLWNLNPIGNSRELAYTTIQSSVECGNSSGLLETADIAYLYLSAISIPMELN